MPAVLVHCGSGAKAVPLLYFARWTCGLLAAGASAGPIAIVGTDGHKYSARPLATDQAVGTTVFRSWRI
jgi:hypothetical protein